METITRRNLLKTGAAVVGIASRSSSTAIASTASEVAEFTFHHDHIIGTSLDLCIVAKNEHAAYEAERVVLDEIERLRRVLSIYDPSSEINRVNNATTAVPVSAELAEVLHAYEQWHHRTGGALSGVVGKLTQAWKVAEANNDLPSAETLEQIVREMRSPGWHLDRHSNTVLRTTDCPINLNALGKSYIVQKAIDAVRVGVRDVTGILVNVGGDIATSGRSLHGTDWAIGIQSPFHRHHNAAPLAAVRLTNQAIASSGGYFRYYTIGGERYSHVIDPRTGWPATEVAGATVVASDAVTANALATALCVLAPDEGLKLVAGIAGAECLIIAIDGRQFRSAGLELFGVSKVNETGPEGKKSDAKEGSWPEGFQVTVMVELPKIDAKRYRRPYAAVWIEDDAGKAVRTLVVWGKAPKYLKDLSDWWKIGRGNAELIKAVTMATKGPGNHELVWDGKDDQGNVLGQGTYTIRVEVHREFGAHLRQSGKIECLGKPSTLKLEKNAEIGETVVEYGKPEKKKK